MKNTIVKLTLGAIILLATTSSYAQPPQGHDGKKQPTAAELIKKMDADKDGKLSKKEVKGPIKDDFEKIDTDKDGYLTLEELKKAPKPERKGPEEGR